MEANQEDGKARKPRQRQSQSPSDAIPEGKIKRTVHLSVDADQRLGVHATMTRRSASDLVESLINSHLRTYVVQKRGPTPLPHPVAGQVGPVESPVESLPIGEEINPSPIVDASAFDGRGGDTPETTPTPRGKRKAG